MLINHCDGTINTSNYEVIFPVVDQSILNSFNLLSKENNDSLIKGTPIKTSAEKNYLGQNLITDMEKLFIPII